MHMIQNNLRTPQMVGFARHFAHQPGRKNALVHQKQVLYIAKVGAAIFFDLHPYIVARIGATDMIIHV